MPTGDTKSRSPRFNPELSRSNILDNLNAMPATEIKLADVSEVPETSNPYERQALGDDRFRLTRGVVEATVFISKLLAQNISVLTRVELENALADSTPTEHTLWMPLDFRGVTIAEYILSGHITAESPFCPESQAALPPAENIADLLRLEFCETNDSTEWVRRADIILRTLPGGKYLDRASIAAALVETCDEIVDAPAFGALLDLVNVNAIHHGSRSLSGDRDVLTFAMGCIQKTTLTPSIREVLVEKVDTLIALLETFDLPGKFARELIPHLPARPESWERMYKLSLNRNADLKQVGISWIAQKSAAAGGN